MRQVQVCLLIKPLTNNQKMNDTAHRNALHSGYELFWYRMERVLGQGAFGITYLAHDINLDRQVAIKEYMPAQLSTRESSKSVHPLSAELEEDFQAGLARFISEARTLTRFEHPNLIRVFNVFEANNTAYMVMNYEVGQSLQTIIKRKQIMSEERLTGIIKPLMSGLHKMHIKGFIHRDIKPGNIFIRTDGAPVLLDFGSARQTLQNNPHTLTNFVSPGYAPIEQYASKSDKQGPWTDIYGLGATMYRIIAGVAPMNAIDRSESITHDGYDCYLPLSQLVEGKYSEKFLAALDHALAFRAQDRPQNIEKWWEEFGFVTEEVKPLATQVETDTAPTMRIDDVATYPLNTTGITEDKTLGKASEATTIENNPEEFPQTEKATGVSWSHQKKAMIAGAVIITVLVLIALPVIFDNRTAEMPVAEVQLQDSLQDTDINAAGLTDNEIDDIFRQADETEITDIASDDPVQQLLVSAEENIRELKLTTPKDNNAYDKFMQVLELDPQNETARRGIETISDKYISLAYGAINSHDTERARFYISKAKEIWPESPKIAQADAALNASMGQKSANAPAESVQEPGQEEKKSSVVGDIRKWFKETAEKDSEIKKEETASDRVIKSMGGK
jgi:serine/threonine protein kinase